MLPTRDRLSFVKTVESSLQFYVGVAVPLNEEEHIASCFQAAALQKNLTYDLQAAEADVDVEGDSPAAQARRQLKAARGRLAHAALKNNQLGLAGSSSSAVRVPTSS